MEKPCEVCGKTIVKPPSCSLLAWPRRRFCSPACKSKSQKGQKPWNFGRRTESRAQKLPCRICGKPTKHHGTSASAKRAEMLRCENPDCVEQSRLLKNARLSANLRGRRCSAGTWKNVALISPEELLLTSWFADIGFTPQYKVRTPVVVNKHGALTYRLDFACGVKRLYVEIDGSVHRHANRKIRDARRDSILTSLGWSGLRIPAEQVMQNPDDVKNAILHWLTTFV